MYIFEKRIELDVLSLERYFHNSSYGFRPGRSCHSALNTITTWGLTPWVIKADIKKYYDAIDQKRLVSILSLSIKDPFLMDILYKLFQVSVKNLHKGGFDCSKGVGVPQGNPLSPILVNIYLNELDHFIGNLKKELDEVNARQKIAPECSKAVFATVSELSMTKTKKARFNLKRVLYREKIRLAIKSGIQANLKADEFQGKFIYNKVYYVRYAGDYLIGIKGPKSLAFLVKKRVADFLKANLHFSLEKSEIVYASHEKISFLGFDIKVPKRSERSVVETRRILNFKKIRNRILLKKKSIENRYQNALLQIYEVNLMRKLKALGKSNGKTKIEHLANQDALKLHKFSMAEEKN